MARVVTTFPGGYKTRSVVHGVAASDKDFVFNTDYSEGTGGEGNSPSPWATFLASFMACQSVHILTYCMDNNIPTDDLKIELDYTTAEDNREVLDFKVHVFFPKHFPEDLIAGAIYSARHCKVVQHILDFKPTVTYTTEVIK